MTRSRHSVTAGACLCAALLIAVVGAWVAVGQTISTSGSGFVVDASGYILTNYHVVEGATGPIKVTLSDGTVYEARLIDFSPTTDEGGYDAALLKIEATGLATIPVADSDEVQLFDQVIVLGYPLSFDLGVSLNVTGGNVTAFRKIEDSPELFQIDAVVNPGNSGGPALDEKGRAIGIVTSKLVGETVEGVSFLIPINNAAQLLSKNIAGWSVSTSDVVRTSRQIIAAATPAIVYIEWSDVYLSEGEYNETFTQSRDWFAEFWQSAGYVEVSLNEKGVAQFVECPAEAVGPFFQIDILFSKCTGSCAAGIAFFPADQDQWSYMILIHPDGSYASFKSSPGQSGWSLAGSWRESSNLKQGKDIVNRVQIQVLARYAQISFNGASPGSLGTTLPLGGTIALCVVNFNGTTTIRFDNLRIYESAGSDMN